MMKKLMCRMLKSISLSVLIAVCLCRPAFAEESTYRNTETGQTEISYTADKRPPVEEIPKGDGLHVTSPITGDATMIEILELLVISSAGILMLIIYIKKRRTI